MEPTLIKNNKLVNNQKKIIITLIVLFVCLFVGTSYSLLTSTDETEDVITFTAGELNLEVKTSTDTTVNLPDELPKSEEEVENPIILNLKNTGNLEICEYRLKLIADESPDSTLATSYIRFSVSENNSSYSESKLLSETENLIYTGFNLKPDGTKTIYLKVWLDEAALDNEEVLNKDFYGKMDAELLQKCETEQSKVAADTIKDTLGEGGLVGIKEDNTKTTSKDDEVREYRYSGATANNYIYFNCKDNQAQSSSTCEKWRILGIFKDESGQEHIKIVQNQTIPGESMPLTYQANGKSYKIRNSSSSQNAYWNYDGSNYNNNWADSGLMYWLNSLGTDSANQGYLKTLSTNAQNMIAETKYYLGTVTYGSTHYIEDTAVEAYNYERAVSGCSENKGPSANSSGSAVTGNSTCRVWANNAATWTGKIALMYPSDYGYSADSSYWKTILGYNSFNGTASNTSWLQKEANHTSYEWLLSPTSNSTSYVAGWSLGGYLTNAIASYNYGVRASLNLKSEVMITGGNGTDSAPYEISL